MPQSSSNQGFQVFMWFVAAREYFSVINKRVAESYKLNLYDITQDPVDVRIWLNTHLNLKAKDVDQYYSVCAASNLVWYLFYCPWVLACSVTMWVSTTIVQAFRWIENGKERYMNALFAVYLLHYIFISKVKEFPEWTKQEKFKWFMQLFENFYKLIFEQTSKNWNDSIFEKVKKELFARVELFFFLFEHYQRIETMIVPVWDQWTNHFAWMLDALQSRDKSMLSDIELQSESRYLPVRQPHESLFLDECLPQDVIIKYLYGREESIEITDSIVSKIFPESLITQKLLPFLESWDTLWEMIDYLTSRDHLKQTFIDLIGSYMQERMSWLESISEEISNYISQIGEWESLPVPSQLQTESNIADRLMSFYMSMMWSQTIGRGDSMYLRYHAPALNWILKHLGSWVSYWNASWWYYSNQLELYSISDSVYKTLQDGIKGWKWVLYNPKQVTVYQHPWIVGLIDESALFCLLQDFQPRGVKLYLKNTKIMAWFEERYRDLARYHTSWASWNNNEYLQHIFSLTKELYQLYPHITVCIPDSLRFNLKESLYTADFAVWYELIIRISWIKQSYWAIYPVQIHIWIMATLRETLFWALLLATYMMSQWKNQEAVAFFHFIITYVIGVTSKLWDEILSHMVQMSEDMLEWLKERHEVDEIKSFLQIGSTQWLTYYETLKDTGTQVTWTQVLWLKWYLQHLTYYSKRSLAPST